MRETSRRPRRLKAGRPVLAGQDVAHDPLFAERKLGLLGPFRVVRRAGGVVLWTLPCMLVQAVCIVLPGRLKVTFARFYWATACRLLGVGVRVIGAPAGAGGR